MLADTLGEAMKEKVIRLVIGTCRVRESYIPTHCMR